MLKVKSIIVFKIKSYCAGTVQTREESEKRCDLRRQKKIERGGTAVTFDGRPFHRRAAVAGINALSPTVDRRVRRTSRDVDEAERSRQ